MSGSAEAARSSTGRGAIGGVRPNRTRETLSSPGSAVLATLRHEAARKLLLGVGPRLVRPAELEAELQIPRNTLHRHRHELEAAGALVRHDMPGPPHFVLYELSTRGLEMRDLVLSVAGWLKESESVGAPDAVGKRAWRAVIALSEGWGSALVQALVNEPRTAAEIERELDHRLTPAQRVGLLGRLRASGIMERVRVEGRLEGSAYAMTGWGRAGVGQLARLARFESLHLHGRSAPVTVADGVGALCATLPLIQLSDQSDAILEFAVTSNEHPLSPAGRLWATLNAGRVMKCRLGSAPEAATIRVQGSVEAWMAAVLDCRPSALSTSGQGTLGEKVVRELHTRL